MEITFIENILMFESSKVDQMPVIEITLYGHLFYSGIGAQDHCLPRILMVKFSLLKNINMI